MTDNAANIAADPNAPAAERYDAQAAMMKSGSIADFLPTPEVQHAIDQIQEMWRETEMAKALTKNNVIPGPWGKPKSKIGGQSVFIDEYQIVTQGNYWDRPGLLGFDSMRAMVEQTPILNGIILTRIRQVQRFCRPQADKASPGFRIQHVDASVTPNETQQESMKLLTDFMTNCGWEKNPRRRKILKRDNLTTFMAKSVRDSLVLDSCPIETEFKRDRTQGLDGFYALDGGTIRLCKEEGYEGDDEIIAVQVIQGNVRTVYTWNDLVYEVRNPRTDVTASGYGYSETEMLIKVVTYLLNTMTYNGSFFDKNSIPRGVLQLFGNYDNSDIAAFKRYWNGMVRGIQNAHNMPILVSKDQESGATFTEVGGQLDEMSFGKWMSFLTSIACAVYGMAPEEVSMESFSSDKSSLSGSDTGEKLVSSADKGLRPLMSFYEGVFSDFIIQEFSPEYCFRFQGLDDEDAEKRFEMRKIILTWDEARAEQGIDAVGGKLGKAPINPALLSVWQAAEGIGQPEPEEEDFGTPVDGDGDGQVQEEETGGEEEPDFGDPGPDAQDEAAPPDMAKAFPFPIFRIEP